MAQQSKGARRGYNLRWADVDRDIAAARAQATGHTMLDYLLELVRSDHAAANGEPVSLPLESVQTYDTLPGIERAIHDAA